jgi:hypothetical protein
MGSDDIELDIDDLVVFVDAVLGQAGRSDLFDALDEPGTTEATAKELLALAAMLGASVEVDEQPIAPDDFANARVLIPGTRVHLKMRRIGWLGFLALVPAVATAIATGGLALPALSALPLLGTVTENASRLSDDEKLVYVAIAALGKSLDRRVTTAEVQAHLNTEADGGHFDEATIRNLCDGLVMRRVLTSEQSGFAVVI